ncbi:MAG: radical SAM protein [Firmicutes bacterium]|nr:radical SAM protein [Bacillota bacterium]
MRYEGSVYRPPSEAGSLIIQLTIGCARNDCTFCTMFKDKRFRVRKLHEVVEDMEMARQYYRFKIRRIFFADGDALVVKTKDLLYILGETKRLFPEVERISIYGAPKDVLMKSDEELAELKAAGLDMVYMGAESGDDEVLRRVKKNATHDEIVEAGLKLKKANIPLSLTLISGLGGRERYREHALESARLVSEMNPEYVGLLTLLIEESAPIYEDIKAGRFQLLSPEEVIEETKIFIENTDAPGCIFRSNHASNYVSLAGTFNEDKGNMLARLDWARKNAIIKPEYYRAL